MFQSTLPTRGSDAKAGSSRGVRQGFNPRSPRGGATAGNELTSVGLRVSIHAPHEGERQGWPLSSTSARRFNPRSPRGGATRCLAPRRSRPRCFNPRSPRGGATFSTMLWASSSPFQSTLPTRGSDLVCLGVADSHVFQSTLPTRGSDGGKVHLYAAFPRIC